MLEKQFRNLSTDGTITRTMVVNMKSMTHVYSNTFLSNFLRRVTMLVWKMSLLHWLRKLTYQTLRREKNYWRTILKKMAPWGLNVKDSLSLSKIALPFILTTGFVQIVIMTWFTETILVPIIIVPNSLLLQDWKKNWLFPTEMYCWTITNHYNKLTGYK